MGNKILGFFIYKKLKLNYHMNDFERKNQTAVV